jgi:hypothetical protein
VTSFVDSTAVEVLSVVGWSDLTEERPTQRHFEEKETRCSGTSLKNVNNARIVAWPLTFCYLESLKTYGTY